MGTQVIFFLFLLFPISYANCLTSYCPNSNFRIDFPFCLESQQPQNSKNPGFNLSCTNRGKPILDLPYAGEFYVQGIYYNIEQIELSDPDNCSQDLLSLNLSSSPFMAVSYQNYTFLSCPRDNINSLTPTIDCLSNSTTSILATKFQDEVARLYMCKTILTLPVPVSYQFDLGLPLNLELTWNVSVCRNRGSSTGARNNQTVLRVVTLCPLASAILIPTVIICISCLCIVRRRNHQARDVTPTSTTGLTNMGGGSGIDELTIESFEKLTLDASLHIPGPNGITCTIFLSDYRPKETVKLMPECEHCFHVECIDIWLRINNNCLVCRNTLC